MFDPAIYSGLLQGLQRAINHSLKYDPGTQYQLQQLHGKQMCLRTSRPDAVCYLQFNDKQVQLASYSEAEIDCEISGQLQDIMALAWRDTHSLANSGVKVSGDISLLARLQNLIQQMDIDWEEMINEVIGDTGGHLLASFARAQHRWWQARVRELPQWLPEYLSEELRAIPAAAELDIFYRDVRKLQQDTDRLAAKIAKLHNQKRSAKRHSESQPPAHKG